MEPTIKTIRFPSEILEQMQPWLIKGNHNFSAFVMDAIKNYMRILKYNEGIEDSFGAWKSEDHPELDEGVETYIRSAGE